MSMILLFVFAAASALMSAASAAEVHCEAPPGVDTWCVQVVNQLRATTLRVHCKSKNDDLGLRELRPGGGDFDWGFQENVFKTTLYWCYMRTANGHSAFDVFWPEKETISNWLHYRCNWKQCVWIAKDDGIYIRNIPESRDEFHHKWEPGW